MLKVGTFFWWLYSGMKEDVLVVVIRNKKKGKGQKGN